MNTTRTLVAGFGNVLRGDDGFGVEVIRALAARTARDGIELLDVGTGGIRLAQQLLAGYDRLIVVDAMAEGGAPGTLYVREVTGVEPVSEVDLHLAVPSRALALARAVHALPPRVYIIGCEPAETEELIIELSAPVRAAVERALHEIDRLLAEPVQPDIAGVTGTGA